MTLPPKSPTLIPTTNPMWLIIYLVIVLICVIYFFIKVFSHRTDGLRSHGQPLQIYARRLALGIVFVLAMAFTGPLISHLWRPLWPWGFGFLFTGLFEWVYVLPALAWATRAGQPHFRQGARAAAVIFLAVDLFALLLIWILSLPIPG